VGVSEIHFLIFWHINCEKEGKYFSKGKPVETLGRQAAGLNPGTIGIR
jgi:hypothetical protein